MRISPLFVAALALSLSSAPLVAQQTAGTKAIPAVTPAATTYVIDTVHSELSFRIRHLLGRVAGNFGDWEGTIVMDSVNPANSSVNVTIRTASIDTRVPARDAHLRTNDFFAVDSFPTMTFKSTSVSREGRHLRIAGDLTIRGRTKPVVLSGTYEGRFPDPWGKMRTAFIASTTINRQDFGVAFNGPFLDIGQIGDEVWIEIAVEAVQL